MNNFGDGIREKKGREFYEESTCGPERSHHLQVKGGSVRDLPVTREFVGFSWRVVRFPESVKGVRLRGGRAARKSCGNSFTWS